MSANKDGLSDFLGFIVVVVIIIAGAWIIATNMVGCVKSQVAKNIASVEAGEAMDRRFAKAGDTIELDGKRIVILKEYIFSQDRRFEVRLEDGSITDVMGAEIIDVKPIKKE